MRPRAARLEHVLLAIDTSAGTCVAVVDPSTAACSPSDRRPTPCGTPRSIGTLCSPRCLDEAGGEAVRARRRGRGHGPRARSPDCGSASPRPAPSRSARGTVLPWSVPTPWRSSRRSRRALGHAPRRDRRPPPRGLLVAYEPRLAAGRPCASTARPRQTRALPHADARRVPMRPRSRRGVSAGPRPARRAPRRGRRQPSRPTSRSTCARPTSRCRPARSG